MKIGEQLAEEAKERMDKAHCMGDTENKNGKKVVKSAHGMIFVLGARVQVQVLQRMASVPKSDEINFYITESFM